LSTLDGTTEPVATEVTAPHQTAPATNARLGYALAASAALFYGTASVLIRIGVTRYGSPLTGVAIALMTGILALLPLAVVNWRGEGAGWRPGRRALLFVFASGLCAVTGFSANTFALSQLPVVVVTPISSSYPLVTVLLARLFLHGTEHINARTILGALLIVAGVILVTLSHR
jgi:drug/metabolite transporter (DMT)-like permease